MITAVLLNWKRPKDVTKIISTYQNYSLIDEILVFNNNVNKKIKIRNSKKLTIIDSSKDLGLYTRFSASSLAKNRCIMLCDDDILITMDTLKKLYSKWRMEPNICHSLHGRMVNNKYSVIDAYGEVHVCLTRCTLVDRRICALTLTIVDRFEDLPCLPKGNGEDIIMSFVAMYASRKFNKAYNYDLFNFSGHASFDKGEEVLPIHLRWPGHLPHRQRVVERCIKVFGFEDWPKLNSNAINPFMLI